MHQRISLTACVCWLTACLSVGAPGVVCGQITSQAVDAPGDQAAASRQEEQNLAHFERKIRPALLAHCAECHASDTESSGGLLLDSRAGWLAGGDSGPAIVPGHADQSRLWLAITYDDPNLQMPPEGKLPQETIDAFAEWIDSGAVDPRESSRPVSKAQAGLPVEQAHQHWAYRPTGQPIADLEQLESAGDKCTPIDAFINHRLAEQQLAIAPQAQRTVIMRRLSFDLTGLPPTAEDLQAALVSEQTDEVFLSRYVDQLLDSPAFGEHFARKWMDVARYGESITLRGFILPEAWRYRDYLVEAFASDRPFDQMVREQIAGDLLPHKNLREQQLQLIATGFLALGNTNLEQQDKTQLDMDYIDEQLEVIGRAFLGQTIGCARCHDHKFDPIPTRDYYALAGIFRSAQAMEHENVSKWIEQPLPLSDEEQRKFAQLSDDLAKLERRIGELKRLTNKQAKGDKRMVPVGELAGVVVDSNEAKLVGEWTTSSSQGRIIGDSYIHDGHQAKGSKTATFEPNRLPPGSYEVRLAYTAGTNRATNALVRVFSADGEATLRINQRNEPDEEGSWVSLGVYRFERDGQAFVLVSNDMTDGHVIADAVQFLPQSADNAPQTLAGASVGNPPPGTDLASKRQGSTRSNAVQLAELEAELKSLEAQRKPLEAALAARPRYLTIVEKLPASDIPIHIRGDVHNLGDVVPRGFLTALNTSASKPPRIDKESSGRLEFATWLSSPQNPLTARVYANRVWSWLMGRGLVASVNNFGTTGTAPTHPELLDWLAQELIRGGWSTKNLVRQIVHTSAYRRSLMEGTERHRAIDPDNALYWRGHSRRLPVEAIRDAMLSVSGELDRTVGGSIIRPGTKSDYDYQHESTRRSIYQPVFRNSLPELFEAFDFADSSMSIGQRPRSTVATQALVLLNHPWVAARASAAAQRLRDTYGEQTQQLLDGLYVACLGRYPTQTEQQLCLEFLSGAGSPIADSSEHSGQTDRLEQLVHATFAALDFRYLE